MSFRCPSCTLPPPEHRQHFQSPSRIVERMKSSRIPSGGWTQEQFQTRNGRNLIVDMVMAHRASVGKGLRVLMPKLVMYFDGLSAGVVRRFTERAIRVGIRGTKAAWEEQLLELELDPGMHEALWGQAIEDVMAEQGLEFQMIITKSVQSVVDSTHKTTLGLLGKKDRRVYQLSADRRAKRLVQKVADISRTTRRQLEQVVERGISDGLTVHDMAKEIRDKVPKIGRSRSVTIARTEMGQAADEGRKEALRNSSVVSHVSVIGCTQIEPNGPLYNGVPTCNIEDVPIGDVDKLEFHINHTGTIIPSRFLTDEEVPYGVEGGGEGQDLPSEEVVIVEEVVDAAIDELGFGKMLVVKGGPGSGFFGHAGRPGETGGSSAAGQAQTAFSHTLNEGGASVDFRGSHPDGGYMVSPYKDREMVVSANMAKSDLVKKFKEFRDQNADLVSKSGHFIGAWMNKGKIYLDVSLNVQSQESASMLAREHNQLAIWDVTQAREVAVT